MSLDKSLLEKVREVAYKHALINAYKHKGKAALQPVISKIIAEIPEIRKRVRDIIGIVKEIIDEVNELSINEQKRIIEENWPEYLEERREKEKKTLPPLPNASVGKVATRFAPNPDYTIHLGNARPALLSYWYAVEYKGKMILRFEDTDPRTKAPFPEAYDRIKEDLKWLGIKWDEEYIQSLRLPIFYEMLRKLTEKGGAYVDKCSPEEFRKYRDQGKACPHRDLPPEKHLEELDKILEGYYGEGEAVIRVKTDLKHPDPSVRDWVAARIIDTTKSPHPVVGEKYILWPTYNLAAAIDDHLMGVTHILRAKEHVSNTIKQKYLYDHMGWKYPETIHFGRLSLEGVILSKSKMRQLISERSLEPYVDPRFGTLSGLRRRGIVREALWEIIKSVGTKPIDAHISYVNLAAINRAIIDPVTKRFMAVEEPIELRIVNIENDIEAKVIRHPSTHETTHKIVPKESPIIWISRRDLDLLNKHKIVRLMGLANITLKEPRILNGKLVIDVEIHSFEQDEAKKHRIPIIQWVKPDDYVLVDLIVPEGLEIKHRVLYAEKDLSKLREDIIIQFYRIGFARIDHVGENKLTCIFAHT